MKSLGVVPALLILSACAFAQNAQLSGLIRDQSDAAIPNAVVTIINQHTGAQRVTISNNMGLYCVLALNPGVYKLRVEKAGFKATVYESVALEASENGRLDFALQLGEVLEGVVVTGDTQLVN